MYKCTASAALMLGVSASALLLGSAHAQSANEANVSEVVVTGSRIVRDGYQAPTPVTVVTTQQLLETTPTNIPDGLNRLPQFAGSRSETTPDSTTNANRVIAGNNLNLRNVGAERVLILLDGRRVPPTIYTGVVDSNIIPQALVQRVDVVTAGASAVYGADAISGVVNYVLDTRFTGLKGSIQGGISQEDDDGSSRVTLAGGIPIGKFHFIGSAEHYERRGITNRLQRRESALDLTSGTMGTGTAADPNVDIENVVGLLRHYGGRVVSGPFANFQFTTIAGQPQGVLTPMNLGVATGNGNARIGGDGYIPNGATVDYYASLNPSIKTSQFFGRVRYDITPDINLFAQGAYSKTQNQYTSLVDFHDNTRIYADNPYLKLTPAQAATLGPNGILTVNRYAQDEGNQFTDVDNWALNFTGGLEGRIGGYNFDAYFTHGEAESETHQMNAWNQYWYAAVDPVDEGRFRTGVANGNIVCRITLVNPALVPGCRPVNILGARTPSQVAADRAFYERDAFFITNNKLDEVGGNITGAPFSTWAGEVSVSVGASMRWQSLGQISNGDPAQVIDYTGLRAVPANVIPTPFYRLNVGLANGKYDVKEVYGETVVPLINDVPFFQSFELNGAARYTDYSTSGGVWTWKAGFSWQPNNDLRFRGTRSKDIRAPTLYDLYSGAQTNSGSINDRLLNLTYSVRQIQAGNPNLIPEQGDTLSLGVVFQPTFFDGFQMSTDYYDLKISDQITTINAGTINTECFESGGTDPLCARQTRVINQTSTDPTNLLTSVDISPVNLAFTRLKGIDFDVSYNFNLGPGRANVRAFVGRTLARLANNGLGGVTTNSVGGNNAPKWRANVNIGYSVSGFSSSVSARYTDSTLRSTNVATVFADPIVNSYVLFDLSMRYQMTVLGHRMEPFMTINNVLANDRDRTGRYYTAGLRFTY